jgi:sirohydrochlorin ferrochelatase
MLLLVVACGPSQKERTLKSTLAGVNAAREALVAWDETTQLEIVRTATRRADGEAKLAQHRADRAEIVAAFEAIYRALAIAAMDLDKANLVPIALEAQRLYALVKELKTP